MDLKWIFDGIGTELLSLCVGAISGGCQDIKLAQRVPLNKSKKPEQMQNKLKSLKLT